MRLTVDLLPDIKDLQHSESSSRIKHCNDLELDSDQTLWQLSPSMLVLGSSGVPVFFCTYNDHCSVFFSHNYRIKVVSDNVACSEVCECHVRVWVLTESVETTATECEDLFFFLAWKDMHTNWNSLLSNIVLTVNLIYIYHALINTLRARVMHINLNMIFYTHVEHSPNKTIYIKSYTKNKNKTHMHTHTQWLAETGYWY